MLTEKEKEVLEISFKKLLEKNKLNSFKVKADRCIKMQIN